MIITGEAARTLDGPNVNIYEKSVSVVSLWRPCVCDIPCWGGHPSQQNVILRRRITYFVLRLRYS